MKRIILFFKAILFVTAVFGQEDDNIKPPFRISFDEFTISTNRTIAFSNGEEGRFGCGAGVYHTSMLSKRWNYMYGLEYNYTSLFIDDVPLPAYTHRIEKNVAFHVHTFSLQPLAFRFNTGKNVKYFLESGLFLGFSIANKKGEAYLINRRPTPENPDNYTPVDIGDDRGIYCGPSFGMGMRIPMKNIEWIVKADYIAGLSWMIGFDQYYRLGVGLRKLKSQ
jgi:hypothetical protein